MGANLDSIPCAWPGYPPAVTAGGFCFISGTMGLNADGSLVSGWSELPTEGASLGSGFPCIDAVEGPPGAQTWAALHQIRSLMTSLGGDLEDLLQLHLYQKEKRLFPVCERVRMLFEPAAPAPSSGIGVCGASPDGNAWFAFDGIGIAPGEWRFGERRRVLRYPGEQPPGSHYSQAVQAGPYIFVAGHIPNDTSKPGNPVVRGYEDVPEEGRFLRVGRSHPDARDGLIAAQTWFTYEKIRRVLEAAGSGLDDVVNLTIFLQDMKDYPTFHRIHERCFQNSAPALTVTEVREVGHQGTMIEIEAIAMRPSDSAARRTIELAPMSAGAHCALATAAGSLIFLSGQVGLGAGGRAVTDVSGVPKSLRPHAAGIARVTGRPEATFQTFVIFENVRAILREAGGGLPSLARLIVYLEDFRDFLAFDLVCRHYVPDQRPALSCVAIPRVSPVPGTRLCVEATAVIE